AAVPIVVRRSRPKLDVARDRGNGLLDTTPNRVVQLVTLGVVRMRRRVGRGAGECGEGAGHVVERRGARGFGLSHTRRYAEDACCRKQKEWLRSSAPVWRAAFALRCERLFRQPEVLGEAPPDDGVEKPHSSVADPDLSGDRLHGE